MSCFPRFDKSGNFNGIVHIARDITERRQLLEELTKKETFEASVIDGITDMILVINPEDYKILSANKAYLDKEGFTLKDIQGKTCYEVTHLRKEPCCQPNATFPMLETIETKNVSREEHIHYDKEGKPYYAEIITSPVMNNTNKLLHIIHISRDITERKRMEVELKNREEQYRSTFDLAGVGIAHVSLDGYFLRLNHLCCEILGHSENKIMRLLTSQNILHSNQIANNINFEKRLIAGEIVNHSMEKRLITQDGTVIWLNVTVSLVRDTDGKPSYFIYVLKDITERKLADVQIRKVIEKLRKTLNETITVTCPL